MAGRGMELTKPAWMLKNEEANEQAARDAFEATFGNSAEAAAEEPDDEDDDDDDDEAVPIGPLCAARCSVSGRGFSGGEVGEQVMLTVAAKDDTGRRITWGGAKVKVEAEPSAGGCTTVASVKDSGNGEYSATYSVSEKGNYMLRISINGEAIGGSPFPVYFSPSSLPLVVEAEAPAGSLAAAAAAAAAVATQSAAAGANVIPQVQNTALAALLGGAGSTAVSLVGAGTSAASMGLGLTSVNPIAVDEMSRTIHVGNLTPFITSEQLRLLFSFYGTVTEVRMAGDNNQYAFVEFSTSQEAAGALSMNGQLVGDRALKVEITKTARLVKPGNAGLPMGLGPTATQLQQLTMAQLQQQTLAMQVAQMRVASKDASLGVKPQSAAKAAAAALSKRLMGMRSTNGAAESGKAGGSSEKWRRSSSRSPDRYDSSTYRQRDRSRSRDRRSRRDYRRSPVRRRSRSSERRPRHSHRSRSAERRRPSRHEGRSRSRDRTEKSGKSSKRDKEVTPSAEKPEANKPSPETTTDNHLAQTTTTSKEKTPEIAGDLGTESKDKGSPAKEPADLTPEETSKDKPEGGNRSHRKYRSKHNKEKYRSKRHRSQSRSRSRSRSVGRKDGRSRSASPQKRSSHRSERSSKHKSGKKSKSRKERKGSPHSDTSR